MTTDNCWQPNYAKSTFEHQACTSWTNSVKGLNWNQAVPVRYYNSKAHHIKPLQQKLRQCNLELGDAKLNQGSYYFAEFIFLDFSRQNE